MIDEEEKRLRAYQIWESEGRPEGRDLAHWYQAADGEASATGEGAHYMPYSAGGASAGSLVIKFYHSGDQVRGYVRKIAEAGEDDSIFPSEEMEPEAAFKLAQSHNGESSEPIFVELTEAVEWDPSWGEFELTTSRRFQPKRMLLALRIIRPLPGVARVWLERQKRDCAARWARRRPRRI
ncbi:DUF2934 domain-containing protein [Rhizobium sp. CG5]|uniref:DUF2934 domain-containing protein n=1 Tax=Rhizobium sp. CG5 TaxID=2726076 RepID=UPI00203340CB|nr:DUF2934 domain-containing protein [Rhizobium sp. CG5]MCM2476260.1 DUF2934 domain-containing protein [Rhizobium sp. CG5]